MLCPPVILCPPVFLGPIEAPLPNPRKAADGATGQESPSDPLRPLHQVGSSQVQPRHRPLLTLRHNPGPGLGTRKDSRTTVDS